MSKEEISPPTALGGRGATRRNRHFTVLRAHILQSSDSPHGGTGPCAGIKTWHLSEFQSRRSEVLMRCRGKVVFSVVDGVDSFLLSW